MSVDASDALLRWYAVDKRRLPWRAEAASGPTPIGSGCPRSCSSRPRSPCRALFRDLHPPLADVEALAAADEAEVMAAWAGLGYYARARNLIACARKVAGELGGRFPDTEEGLRKLPGIGRYTAAAIAAIAFGRRAVVVDANVERVVARLFAVESRAAGGAGGDLPPRRLDHARRRRRRFRAGDDGPRRDDLHPALARLRPLPARLRAARRGRRAIRSPIRARRPRRPGRGGRGSPTGSSMTATSCSSAARPEGLLGGMLALPTDSEGAPAEAEWSEAGSVDHVFTHFALTLRLLCADAGGAAERDLVADRPARRGGPADPVRPPRRPRRRMAGGGMRPGFTGAGLDRADHLRLDEARLAELAASLEARLLRLAGLDPELDEDGRLGWGAMAEAGGAHLPRPSRGRAAVRAAGPGRAGPARLVGLRLAQPDGGRGHRRLGHRAKPDRMAQPPPLLRRLRHCRRRPFRGGWGRRCAGCGLEHFPRVDPVVIMLAEHDGRVLLGRQPQYPAGRYSALAGFVEPGESIEEAVARELGEEAGHRGERRPLRRQPALALPRPADDRLHGDRRRATRSPSTRTSWRTRSGSTATGVEAALAGEPDAPFLAPPHFAIAHTLLRHWADTNPPRHLPGRGTAQSAVEG